MAVGGVRGVVGAVGVFGVPDVLGRVEALGRVQPPVEIIVGPAVERVDHIVERVAVDAVPYHPAQAVGDDRVAADRRQAAEVAHRVGFPVFQDFVYGPVAGDVLQALVHYDDVAVVHLAVRIDHQAVKTGVEPGAEPGHGDLTPPHETVSGGAHGHQDHVELPHPDDLPRRQRADGLGVGDGRQVVHLVAARDVAVNEGFGQGCELVGGGELAPHTVTDRLHLNLVPGGVDELAQVDGRRQARFFIPVGARCGGAVTQHVVSRPGYGGETHRRLAGAAHVGRQAAGRFAQATVLKKGRGAPAPVLEYPRGVHHVTGADADQVSAGLQGGEGCVDVNAGHTAQLGLYVGLLLGVDLLGGEAGGGVDRINLHPVVRHEGGRVAGLPLHDELLRVHRGGLAQRADDHRGVQQPGLQKGTGRQRYGFLVAALVVVSLHAHLVGARGQAAVVYVGLEGVTDEVEVVDVEILPQLGATQRLGHAERQGNGRGLELRFGT